MGQEALLPIDKTHKHPRRKIVRCMYEVSKRSGVRAFEYELDCGHTVVRNGSMLEVESVDCKLCPMVPRPRLRPKGGAS